VSLGLLIGDFERGRGIYFIEAIEVIEAIDTI
jgi:hypothetical protein